MRRLAPIAVLALLPSLALADAAAFSAFTVTPNPDGTESYSVTIQLLLAMTALTLLPSALIMLTPFTRIVVILAILRQGIGTAQTPSNQILIGLALFLTFFIMAPVFQQIYSNALVPYLNEEMTINVALELAQEPIRAFMFDQTRETDLDLFADIAGVAVEPDAQEVPLRILIPAFVTSELKSAFLIGFVLLLPFLIIDLLVASILMSMGMVMLSPLIISLPFKLMLFVLVDGWSLIMGTLTSSFFVP